MKVLHAFLLVLLASHASILFAQSKTVKGKVLNESSGPLIGITVLVQGTMIRTITDSTGSFSIKVPALPATRPGTNDQFF